MVTKFNLNDLPFEYDALEPVISKETLTVHHTKHHQTYCDKFNAALEQFNVEETDFSKIFEKVSDKPGIRNAGGGFWNHNFYWEGLCSTQDSNLDENLQIAKAINESFGSFEEFKTQFSNQAAALFGSGWTWLAKDENGKLVIYNTPNQDNFMMDVCSNKEKPVLVIDVWEHAYYLDYQNKRPEHIEKFFSIINWEKVNSRFNE